MTDRLAVALTLQPRKSTLHRSGWFILRAAMNETFCHQKKVVASGRASLGSDPRQLAWRVEKMACYSHAAKRSLFAPA